MAIYRAELSDNRTGEPRAVYVRAESMEAAAIAVSERLSDYEDFFELQFLSDDDLFISASPYHPKGEK